MSFDFDQADTLIYSDNPEALRTSLDPHNAVVHVATPTNAILYEAEVGGGRKRVFYYHQNFDATSRTLAIRLVNLTPAAVTVRAIKHIESPATDLLGVGHRSIVGFLTALIAEDWNPFVLQPKGPGDDVVFAVSDTATRRLASAFVELDIPAGARIKVQVISAASEAAVAGVGVGGPAPGPGDLIGRSGVFDLTRNGTTEGDFEELTWSAGSAPLVIKVPSPPPFPNHQIPQVKPNHTAPDAVYGVLTRRTITFTNPGAAARDVGVYVQACGGSSPGTCMLDDEIIQLGTMSSGASAVKRPGYEIGSYTIPAHDNGSTTIDVLATVDPSGSGPFNVVIAAKGALPQPPPGKQVVFMPGQAWRA